ASHQPFLDSRYSSRSLRRLAALNASQQQASSGHHQQASTPLLAGHHQHQLHHPYHQQSGSRDQGGQFNFLTGGRPQQRSRSRGSQAAATYYSKYGHTLPRPVMNHYVTRDEEQMLEDRHHQDQMASFAAFLDSSGGSSSNR